MDLSLRDLAERSGVSAPMLSQVERGETSPTLAVAGRIAAGLELSLSQLLRLDEGDGVTVVRAGERLLGGRADGHRYEVLTPAAAGPARRGLAAHACARRRHRRPGRPADPRAGQPRDRRRHDGPLRLVCDGVAHDLERGRRGHLRRRPAAPLREPGPRRRRASCR